ncbi:putative ABC-type uncharacterized transport system, periplasmic component [Methylobacterium sp. 4-46]|uniref:ABC transporter substrate-binding protein n=1 Tax=unclassified Methylobacterium TaxID=2615210 RepID=UPI000165C8FD|nr:MULTISPECIES: ABC transporter substrate-binding protein [Methylobacterium]ACA17247.1 putative ABC-type uncharacterized transport system, periplasmic component [Methylobacterium sp. 4-46]WFT82932.1 ABC transporter substrate-binding protein [Methylobacterium nodulans]
MRVSRRWFIYSGFGAAVSWSHALGQGARQWRIGHVVAGSNESLRRLTQAMRTSLDDIGLLESDVKMIPRVELRPILVAETIRTLISEIDILVTSGTVVAVAAKKIAPSSLPIVFLSVGDPVAIGLVETLSHPGANMTGVMFEAAMETYGKRLEFLKELKPGLSRVAVLRAKNDPNVVPAMVALDRLAHQYAVSLAGFDFDGPEQLEGIFEKVEAAGSEAMVVVSGSLTFAHGKKIADLAIEHKIPTSGGFKETVAAGALVSVGPDLPGMSKQGADYIKKHIQRVKPADLPVQQPTRYEVAVNMRTAEMVGLQVPQSILVKADIIIE